MKRLFLIDQSPVLRLGLATLIDRQAGFEICGELSTARDAIHAVPTLKPDLVITDITLPDLSGLELIKQLQALCPSVPILIYSLHDEMLYAQRTIQAGGRGYLMKDASIQQVSQAIQQILNGNIYLSQRVANHLLGSLSGNGSKTPLPHLRLLTDRELEVFELIGRGRNTHDIAEQLCICLRTVEAHRTHIREKLELESAADVIRHAVMWVEAQN